MPKRGTKGSDWFDSLDAELQKQTAEILQDVGQQTSKRAETNRALIEDAWKIWKRFAAARIHLTLEPNYELWAVFDGTFPESAWRWRSQFNPAGVTKISLTDRTPDQGRVGDSLKLEYVEADGRPRVRITFEYNEGEHYYKYSGWKRSWTVHTLYDAPVDRVDLEQVHKIFSDVVKVWYESHLRRNRDILVRHLKKTYERFETYDQ